MKLWRFTFKNEPVWMLIFSFGLVLIGLICVLIIAVARS